MFVHIAGSSLFLSGWNIGSTFHLFMIYNISKTMKSVIKAVINHWDQLMLTFILMLFFIYMFSLWIMTYLMDPPQFGDSFKDINCENLITCF